MRVVLAEKPSVARELAKHLNAHQRKDGYLEGNGYQVTWAIGHLLELQEPGDYDARYKKWSLETLPIVPDGFALRPRGDSHAKKQLSIVQRLLRNANDVICATDAGREGELIFRYILQSANCTEKSAWRLWLKSLTPQAIRNAFGAMRPLSDYDSLFAAARCRSEADWLIGMNATRFYTLKRGSAELLLSIGRVQTPVLAMIVDRDNEIFTFKPQPYWELLTEYRKTKFRHLRTAHPQPQMQRAGHEKNRFETKEDAETLLRQVQGHELVIQRVQRKPQQLQPPQLFDLTELQREANRRFGLSAARTLQIAQTLYERKLISYPRTDSRYLSSDMKSEVPKILEQLRTQKPNEIDRLDLSRLKYSRRVVNDDKVEDHHAIIPTGADPSGLDSTQHKVYNAIVVRLIAAFYPPCEKEITHIDAQSNGVPFSARGVRVVSPGWTELYPRQRKQDNSNDSSAADDAQDLPEFAVNEQGQHKPYIKEGVTAPPKHFTENTLLGAMETAGKFVVEAELREALKEKGLGTPATRAAIIETLLRRSYIERLGKQLKATGLGRYLVTRLKEPNLRSPGMTGEWEAKLRAIERDEKQATGFMESIANFARSITSDSPLKLDNDRWGGCPQCGKNVIKGKRAYGCSGWRDGCKFVLCPSYEGHDLNEVQIRELLQAGSTTINTKLSAEEILLSLVSTGAIMKVDPPDASQTNRDRQGKRGASVAKSQRQGLRNRIDSGAERRQGKSSSEELGACPNCSKPVIEQKKSFSCSGWRDGCGFVIWKTISGKTHFSPHGKKTAFKT